MPSTEWPRVPAFTSMDVWLHDALRVGIEDNRERGERAAEAKVEADARRERMREIARLKRPKKPGSRPYQGLGMSRADWEAAGRPEAPVPAVVQAAEQRRVWIDAGYKRKADWLADGSPRPVHADDEE